MAHRARRQPGAAIRLRLLQLAVQFRKVNSAQLLKPVAAKVWPNMMSGQLLVPFQCLRRDLRSNPQGMLLSFSWDPDPRLLN